MFWNEQEKLWYWYGENKEFTKKGGTTWTWGIRYYTSKDLYNWDDRGLLIPPGEDLNEPLHPTYCIDRPHFQMICATLSDTYTEVTDEYSVHYDGLTPPLTREAPTYFERNGKKYLFTSGTSGYFPNKSDVCVFDDYHGEYRSLGDPHSGDRSETSFSSQITSVIRLPGTDKYIACADRWMPQWYVKPMAKSIQSGMQRHFKDYKPDTSPKEITSVPGTLQKHSENTYLSRYVWLPIEWEGEKPVIRWQKEWRITDL